MGEECSFYFVAAGRLCSCPRTRLIVLCVSFRALLQEAKTDVISFLVFSQIGLLVFLLSLDLVLSREEQQCGSIVVGITASCDTAYNWAYFLWCTIPAFPPRRDFYSDVLFCWTAAGTFLPISLQTVPTLSICDWLVCGFWSLGCLSGWPELLLCCY